MKWVSPATWPTAPCSDAGRVIEAGTPAEVFGSPGRLARGRSWRRSCSGGARPIQSPPASGMRAGPAKPGAAGAMAARNDVRPHSGVEHVQDQWLGTACVAWAAASAALPARRAGRHHQARRAAGGGADLRTADELHGQERQAHRPGGRGGPAHGRRPGRAGAAGLRVEGPDPRVAVGQGRHGGGGHDAHAAARARCCSRRRCSTPRRWRWCRRIRPTSATPSWTRPASR